MVTFRGGIRKTPKAPSKKSAPARGVQFRPAPGGGVVDIRTGVQIPKGGILPGTPLEGFQRVTSGSGVPFTVPTERVSQARESLGLPVSEAIDSFRGALSNRGALLPTTNAQAEMTKAAKGRVERERDGMSEVQKASAQVAAVQRESLLSRLLPGQTKDFDPRDIPPPEGFEEDVGRFEGSRTQAVASTDFVEQVRAELDPRALTSAFAQAESADLQSRVLALDDQVSSFNARAQEFEQILIDTGLSGSGVSRTDPVSVSPEVQAQLEQTANELNAEAQQLNQASGVLNSEILEFNRQIEGRTEARRKRLQEPDIEPASLRRFREERAGLSSFGRIGQNFIDLSKRAEFIAAKQFGIKPGGKGSVPFRVVSGAGVASVGVVGAAAQAVAETPKLILDLPKTVGDVTRFVGEASPIQILSPFKSGDAFFFKKPTFEPERLFRIGGKPPTVLEKTVLSFKKEIVTAAKDKPLQLAGGLAGSAAVFALTGRVAGGAISKLSKSSIKIEKISVGKIKGFGTTKQIKEGLTASVTRARVNLVVKTRKLFVFSKKTKFNIDVKFAETGKVTKPISDISTPKTFIKGAGEFKVSISQPKIKPKLRAEPVTGTLKTEGLQDVGSTLRLVEAEFNLPKAKVPKPKRRLSIDLGKRLAVTRQKVSRGIDLALPGRARIRDTKLLRIGAQPPKIPKGKRPEGITGVEFTEGKQGLFKSKFFQISKAARKKTVPTGSRIQPLESGIKLNLKGFEDLQFRSLSIVRVKPSPTKPKFFTLKGATIGGEKVRASFIDVVRRPVIAGITKGRLPLFKELGIRKLSFPTPKFKELTDRQLIADVAKTRKRVLGLSKTTTAERIRAATQKRLLFTRRLDARLTFDKLSAIERARGISVTRTKPPTTFGKPKPTGPPLKEVPSGRGTLLLLKPQQKSVSLSLTKLKKIQPKKKLSIAERLTQTPFSPLGRGVVTKTTAAQVLSKQGRFGTLSKAFADTAKARDKAFPKLGAAFAKKDKPKLSTSIPTATLEQIGRKGVSLLLKQEQKKGIAKSMQLSKNIQKTAFRLGLITGKKKLAVQQRIVQTKFSSVRPQTFKEATRSRLKIGIEVKTITKTTQKTAPLVIQQIGAGQRIIPKLRIGVKTAQGTKLKLGTPQITRTKLDLVQKVDLTSLQKVTTVTLPKAPTVPRFPRIPPFAFFGFLPPKVPGIRKGVRFVRRKRVKAFKAPRLRFKPRADPLTKLLQSGKTGKKTLDPFDTEELRKRFIRRVVKGGAQRFPSREIISGKVTIAKFRITTAGLKRRGLSFP